MNLKELHYMITLADQGSLSKASEALYITPSALSQCLNSIEEDLGTQLFYRVRGSWTPTAEGEIYLAAAREMLHLKDETYKKIRDIAASATGSFRVGFPPDRMPSIIRHVYPKFHAEYKDISIIFVEANVTRQQEMIAKGELDLGFMTLSRAQRTGDDYIYISDEEIYLAVPANDPRCNQAVATGTGSYPEIDLNLFRDAPFAIMFKGSTLREHQEQIFSTYGFTPKVAFETSRNISVVDMVKEGICCGLVVNSYIEKDDNKVRYFTLKEHPYWEVVMSYKKGSYLTQAEKRFIEISKEYWIGVISENAATR